MTPRSFDGVVGAVAGVVPHGRVGGARSGCCQSGSSCSAASESSESEEAADGVAAAASAGRHVDEIERRVRGKPLRSSATSAIDGPLTRQVRNRAYLRPAARQSLQNFRTRHAPGLSSIFSALTVHFTMLLPFFSAVFSDISSLRLHSMVSIRPVLLLSQLIR